MDYGELSPTLRERLAKIETPFFLFDLARVSNNIRSLREHLQPDRVLYAVKSNSLPEVLAAVGEAECGFEVNTRNEFQKTTNTPAPQFTINSAPVKLVQHIEYMHAHGVRVFAYDSKDEADKLAHHAPGCQVLLRIATSNEGSEWQLNEKFGARPSEALELLRYADEAGLKPLGITFHVGSQCPNLENWRDGIRESSTLFARFPGLEVLDIGGGFPVRYTREIPAIPQIAAAVQQAIAECFTRRPQIWIEPGRFVTGDAALVATSVIGIREQELVSWAYVDMSLFSGLIEIIEDKHQFQYPIQTSATGKLKTYNIAGPSCDGLDVLATRAELPELARGDRVFLLQTGAYSLEYASQFNGLSPPDVFFLRDGHVLGCPP